MVSPAVVVPVLYDAEVAHSRRSPLVHRFGYRATYWLVDFDELPQPRGIARWCTGVRQQDHVNIRGLLKDHGVAAARVVMLMWTPFSAGCGWLTARGTDRQPTRG